MIQEGSRVGKPMSHRWTSLDGAQAVVALCALMLQPAMWATVASCAVYLRLAMWASTAGCAVLLPLAVRAAVAVLAIVFHNAVWAYDADVAELAILLLNAVRAFDADLAIVLSIAVRTAAVVWLLFALWRIFAGRAAPQQFTMLAATADCTVILAFPMSTPVADGTVVPPRTMRAAAAGCTLIFALVVHASLSHSRYQRHRWR